MPLTVNDMRRSVKSSTKQYKSDKGTEVSNLSFGFVLLLYAIHQADLQF